MGIGGLGGSLPSAAVVLVCMFGGYESECARDLFSFALPPFSSHELDDWRERDTGVSLLSAAACLVWMPEDREGERVGGSVFLLYPLNIS